MKRKKKLELYTGDKLCSYGCETKAKYYFKTTKKYCCSTHFSKCKVRRKRSKKYMTGLRVGEKNPNFGIKMSDEAKENIRNGNLKNNYYPSDETRRKMSSSSRLTIEKISKKYPLFFKIEELRYNPNDKFTIQGHCKNHKCENSKEKNGWFDLTYIQFYERIRSLEKHGVDHAYFYCCEECKSICPLFGLNPNHIINSNDNYERDYIPEWLKEKVKKIDGNKCIYCESIHNLEVHHIFPIKLFPQLSLDINYMITACRKCHINIAHSDTECTLGYLSNKICKTGTGNRI